MNQMRQGRWLLHMAFVSAAAGLLGGCRKTNGIDNNNVIRTPYSLYVSDRLGALYNTNDGTNYKLTVFTADGYSSRSLVVSGPNILWVKFNTHLSQDNGLNFNPTDSSVIKGTTVWQSLMLDVPSQSRVYLSSSKGKGLIYSEDHGKTWKVDNAWDPNLSGVPSVQSLAQLKSGDLFAYNDVNNILYKRTSTGGNWTEVSKNGLPASSSYFLSRFNNTLLAADTGGTGVYYSNDGGQNWATYSGLPANHIRSVYAPFDQTLLVGVDSQGVYRLHQGAFEQVTNGMEPNTTVYGIVGKEDTYKNETIKQYIYISSSTGLYRSEDGGQNWIRMREGEFRNIY